MKKMRRKKNAFTLIELIAVLVILAIIALIVTPLVMNIVKKAKDSANKRSVDAYGKAVELAVATYLLDNGDYPTTLDDLTVEYTGNEVACNVKTLSEDGSIYLSECSVKDRDVKDLSTEDGWYHYGKTTKAPSEEPVLYQAYNIGDKVTYNGMDFYVIENSDENIDSVTLLKAEPLTYEEIQIYSSGTGSSSHNYGGYGVMRYGTTSEYGSSYVKLTVETWSSDKLNVLDLKEDNLGYKTRLLTLDELITNLAVVLNGGATTEQYIMSENTPSWVYNENYAYWTMSVSGDSSSRVWYVSDYGNVVDYDVYDGSTYYDSNGGVVRPVVTIFKSAI